MTEDEAKALKSKLYSEADRMHLSGARRDAYVFGALRRAGWRPKRERQETRKG